MTPRTKMLNRFVQFVIKLTMIVCIVGTVVLTIHVLFPYKPFFRTGSHLFGYTDYDRGIPFRTNQPFKIPDSIFRHTWEREDGARVENYRAVHNAGVGDMEVPFHVGQGRLVIADTFHTWFSTSSSGIAMDSSVLSSQIDQMTFYLKARNRGERFVLFLPDLLIGLLYIFCAWHVSKLMRDIVHGNAFKNPNYKRLQAMGLALVFVQLSFFVLGHFWPYTGSFTIHFVSNQLTKAIPLQISASAGNPFELRWLLLGCIVWILAKGFREGKDLQREVKSLEDKVEIYDDPKALI